jgi:hypothetical protein
MKFISLGILLLAFTFCGITDKLKQLSAGGGGNSNVASSGTNSGGGSTSSSGSTAEPAKPTSAQQAIIDGGSGYVWDDQGISWRLPAGWKRMDVSKTQFNYESPDNAFLLASVSDLGDSFPMDTSLKAYYDQAMQKLKSGDYQDVKMVSIDSIPGVEFTEAPPKGKDDVRRHQWIGYRRYLGQVQQLNVMTSTKASNFAKHEDDFTAILYSMKATK